MVKEIVKDPLLLSMKSESASKEDMQTVNDLLDTIKANADKCVGMAANMIGVRKTILVAFIGNKYQIMINPKIISRSKECYEADEGCLSLEGTRKAVRYKTIKVEYLDRKFQRKRQTFSGFEAQIIQHEVDHFLGKLI